MSAQPLPQQMPIALEQTCAALTELWFPHIVGQVNEQLIKVAKVQGDFPWHTHDQEDEMFLVLRGQLRIDRSKADGGAVFVSPGEFFVVPRGVRHNTSAPEETWLVLIEPVTTLHTGTEQTPLTRTLAEQLASLPKLDALLPLA